VKLPEASIAAFEIFRCFIQTGKIFSQDHGPEDLTRKQYEEYTNREYYLLFDCWALGDQLMSVTFRDAVVDAFIAKADKASHPFPRDLQDYIYPLTHPKSKIRQFIIEMAVYDWRPEDLKKYGKNSEKCPEFLHDLAMRLMKCAYEEEPYRVDWREAEPCDYHEHTPKGKGGKGCYLKLF